MDDATIPLPPPADAAEASPFAFGRSRLRERARPLGGPDALVALVRGYNPRTDAALLRRAWAYGEAQHLGQTRRSGEPYFTHPVEVARLLAEQRLDDATLVCALLHDTVEDTPASRAEIEQGFGAEVAELVDGVTKLTKMELAGARDEQAENFRKLFMAMSRDLRVILVKLTDRLHNMRTLRHMPPDKQARKARETMEIYAPLAGRMGMQWMREELEDLAFKVLNPVARRSILRRFSTLEAASGDAIARIGEDIRSVLARAGVDAVVSGRVKRPFSVWRKMEEKGVGFSRLSDIYGFRIVTAGPAPEDACYRALGAVHRRWKAVPGRFKDYISQPKSNGYRSLHTTVSGRDGKIVEVQIRTREMHEVAESGVAAHWSYRDGVRAGNRFAVDPAEWIASIGRAFSEASSHEEFLEAVKLEMYTDQVFCFTPKGDVIKLPRGATPLDFAYAIHTRIGHRTVGAKVDGMRQPLWTRLRNGQQVEIVTAEAQAPQATWIDIVATGRAKAAIRRALRDERRSGHVRLGRELLRVAAANAGHAPVTDRMLGAAAMTLGRDDASGLLAAIGAGDVPPGAVVRVLWPDTAAAAAPEAISPEEAIVGPDAGAEIERGACCQPVPGERIVGIARPGAGMRVHAIDCPTLAATEDESDRWADLHWHPGRHPARYPVTLDLTLANDAGVLGRICTLIGHHGANISGLEFVDRKPDFYRMAVDVEVSGLEHLHSVRMAVEMDEDVAGAARRRAGDPGA